MHNKTPKKFTIFFCGSDNDRHGHRRVKIRAGNWMAPMDDAAETELRHRMCYFYYEPV